MHTGEQTTTFQHHLLYGTDTYTNLNIFLIKITFFKYWCNPYTPWTRKNVNFLNFADIDCCLTVLATNRDAIAATNRVFLSVCNMQANWSRDHPRLRPNSSCQTFFYGPFSIFSLFAQHPKKARERALPLLLKSWFFFTSLNVVIADFEIVN